MSLISGLHRLWEVMWIIFPLCIMCHFPLCAFKIFSLSLVFILNMMCLGKVLCSYFLGFAEPLKSVHLYLSLNFRKMWPLYLQMFFFLLFSFWDSRHSYVKSFDTVLLVTGSVIYLQSFFFFQFLRLDNCYCSVFKFADSIFCPLSSAVKLIYQMFILRYCVSQF